jgi:hypothetical protein
MAHTITLTPEHVELLIEALAHSLEDKRRNPYRRSSYEETQTQYLDAAEKLLRPVKCGRSDSNLFTWIADQIDHSPGVRDAELCQRALLVCRFAATNRYAAFTKVLLLNI